MGFFWTKCFWECLQELLNPSLGCLKFSLYKLQKMTASLLRPVSEWGSHKYRDPLQMFVAHRVGLYTQVTEVF